MSEKSSAFGSHKASEEVELIGTSEANGAYSDSSDTADETAVATAVDDTGDATADVVAAAADTEADPAEAAADDAVTAEAATIEADTTEVVASDAASAADDDGSVFLHELVRAMQTAAGAERTRIAEETERRRQAQIDRVRARQTSEADRMRELARDDKAAIDEWADGETKRIDLERERRATALQEDLETSLAEHSAGIDKEIEGVDAAIAAYTAEVDAFFQDLERETDPILIAQQAARRPAFPELDTIGDVAAAEAAPVAEVVADGEATEAVDAETDAVVADATEAPVVGVMDPDGATEPAESWAAASEWTPEPESDAVSAEAERDDGAVATETAEEAEPVAVSASANAGGSSLFESVSVLRPMGWLRRDSNGADSSSHEE
jgi:hypothetical protein